MCANTSVATADGGCLGAAIRSSKSPWPGDLQAAACGESGQMHMDHARVAFDLILGRCRLRARQAPFCLAGGPLVGACLPACYRAVSGRVQLQKKSAASRGEGAGEKARERERERQREIERERERERKRRERESKQEAGKRERESKKAN